MIESHIQHLLFPRDHDTWLVRTMRYIPFCNVGIFRAGVSSGKDKEQALFRARGIPFFEELTEDETVERLYRWVDQVWKTRNR